VRAVAMAEPQMRCMILLGALQGLRCQEIAGLDRQDVMEADMLLQITQGKGGHERTMLLHRTVLAALQAMPMPPGGTLFRRADGGRYLATNVSHDVNIYLHRLGIESTAHQLRHHFATNVYRLSQDLRLTQELLLLLHRASIAA
jgi:integrase